MTLGDRLVKRLFDVDKRLRRLEQRPTRYIYGIGSPAGVVVARVGTVYINQNGGAGQTLWVKESGGLDATGWIAK